MPIRLLLALVLLGLAAACSSHPKLSADDYYKEATAAFADENWDVAANRYKDLLDQYPFSEHAEEAELQIAHSQYQRKHYAEAIAAFNDFQRMHPMSPHLAEVYYLLGKSYMDQMTTSDRDQAAAENAHGWFRVVIDRYPDSPYAAKARDELRQCRDELAEHELYIAVYYFKRKNVRAGENRVKGILENYPDTAVAPRAVERLAVAYAQAGDEEHERMARAALAEHPIASESADSAAFEGAASLAASESGSSAPRAARAFRASDRPATATLLADLVDRYGASKGVSTAATAPALVDPVAPKTTTSGDPRYGPGPGFEPSGGY